MALKRLGRGIEALIPEEPEASPGGIALVPLDQIHPNPDQPRKEFEPESMRELEQSIAEKGVVQPVTVRPDKKGYELIVGERRWRASTSIGLEYIPAYILDVDSDTEVLEYALIENVQRKDLNAMELAHAYNALVEQHGLSQEEVAQRVGKSRSAITNFIRLLNLPSEIQQSVKNGEISAGHARAFLSLDDEKLQRKAWKKVLKEHLSVRDVEKLVQKLSEEGFDSKAQSKSKNQKSPQIIELEEQLQHQFGTKVQIKNKKKGGTIEIQYYSTEDLERLLELFDVLE